MISGKIYGLYDPRNGDLRYVGQTVRALKTRLQGHITVANQGRTKRHVTHWIFSLLDRDLRPEIRLLGEANSQSELDELEVRLIKDYRLSGCDLTNHASGGGGKSGVPISDEHRKKLHNPIVWAKISKTKTGKPSRTKGRKHRPESIEKMRNSKVGKNSGPKHPLFRHDASDERILKLMRSGLSTTEVGSDLGIDRHTVRSRILKMREAGIETPSLRGETPTEVILERLSSGKSKQQVALELGITVACIWDRLKRAERDGVPVPRSNRLKYSDVEELIAQGLSYSEAAIRLGVCKDTIRWHMRRSPSSKASNG